MTTKKINKILILQGWAILWVVIGHAPLCPIRESGCPDAVRFLYNIAYSFHMPLFILLSGYLFQLTRIERDMPYGKMILEKLQRLGIPFIVFTVIAMVVKSIFAADMVRPSTISLQEFANAFIFPNNGPLNELWFVATIMWYFVLRPLWTIRNRWVQYLLMVVCAALYCLPVGEARDFLCCQHALHYSIFFYLGIFIRRQKILEQSPIRLTSIMLGLTAVCTAICCMVTRSAEIALPLIGITISFLLAEAADRYTPKLFFTFRGYSYQIYLMGIFIQILIKMLFRHGFIPWYGVGYTVCIVAGLYMPVLIAMALDKLNNKYLKLCIGLK